MYPFKDEEYHLVEFMDAPYGPILISREQTVKGVIVFQVAGSTGAPHPDLMAMEVFVTGDSAWSLYCHMKGNPTERPMALDLLWNMWSHSRHISPCDWTLLRVAIVDLRNDVYIARLFFGDPDTQQVKWDCDCRPSDASYLAMRAGAPMYIKRCVWDVAAVRLRETHSYEAVEAMAMQRSQALAGSPPSPTGEPLVSSPMMMAELRPDSLPIIQLLKRQLEIAVAEERYDEAVQLRDHPFMKLSFDIELHTRFGDLDGAREKYSTLLRAIRQRERAEREAYEMRRLQLEQQRRQRPRQGPVHRGVPDAMDPDGDREAAESGRA